MRSSRAVSPPPPPPLAPTTVPYIIDAEFEKWLNGATVDALHNFYTHVLLPEYEKINIPYKTRYTAEYTEIYNRIIAQTTGLQFVVNLVTINDRERIEDVKALKDVIKNMIRQIISDRASKQIPSSSMQSEPTITVSMSNYRDLERQLGECHQREYDAKQLSEPKNALARQIQGAYNAYNQLGFEAARSVTGEGRNYDVISDEMRVQRERLNRLLKQQQEQQQRGGKSKRSKRVKRSKRSKRVKRSKRSSTKRH
jgi:hypothetical protein